MSFFSKTSEQSERKINVKAIEKIKQSPEYQKNQKQIEIITNALVDHADVPIELIDTLIDSVRENVSLELSTTNYSDN